jgi:DnaJ-class molecular chaperone
MSDLAIVVDARSLPAADGLCAACDGNGYHVKASQTFTGVTFKTNCRACKGSGFAPIATRRRLAA